MDSNNTTSGSNSNNATENLLSELLEIVKDKIAGDDAQIDWDPITFAFTVPVGVFGILATLFALITIIQGILSASPGRRKSSRHVIGRWAKTRKTVFNWDEMRTTTFVKTPILRAEALYQALQVHETTHKIIQKTTNDLEPTKNIFSLRSSLRDMVRFTKVREMIEFVRTRDTVQSTRLEVLEVQDDSQKNPEPTPEQTATKANWVRLLDYFGLDDIQFEDQHLEVTATDHIPDELRAVYAYTDVRTIIALGIVAEAVSIEPELGSNYPILVGAEIQIDFRQHPVLGTVAAFSKYGTRQYQATEQTKPVKYRQHPWFIREKLFFALKHSNAEVEYAPPGRHQSFGRSDKSFIHAIDDEGMNSRNRGAYTAQQIIHGTESHQMFCDSNKSTMCGCRSNWDRSSNHNLLWLFVATVPSEAPAVFPSSCVAIRKSLATLCLQSRFWSGPRAHQSIKNLYSISDETTDWPLPLMHKFRHAINRGQRKTYQDTILQVCLQFLYSRNESVSRDQRINYTTIKDLLENIDSWLGTVPRSVLGCRKANLFLTTLVLREVSCGIADGSFKASSANLDVSGPMQEVVSANGTMIQEHLNDLKQLDLYLSKGIRTCLDEMPGNFFITTFDVPSLVELEAGASPDAIVIFQRLQDVLGQCADVAKETDKPQSSVGRHRRSAFEVIDDMIIWRTILIGILFCSAPDNSKMYQSAVWNHVIPLL